MVTDIGEQAILGKAQLVRLISSCGRRFQFCGGRRDRRVRLTIEAQKVSVGINRAIRQPNLMSAWTTHHEVWHADPVGGGVKNLDRHGICAF